MSDSSDMTPDSSQSKIEIIVDGVTVAAMAANLDRRSNAGVNMLPDLLRRMADQMEEWNP